MTKTKTINPKEREQTQFSAQAENYTDGEIIVVHAQLHNADDQVIVPVDYDAQEMSKQDPTSPYLTVYYNGIPTTLSLKKLVTDIVLDIKEQEA